MTAPSAILSRLYQGQQTKLRLGATAIAAAALGACASQPVPVETGFDYSRSVPPPGQVTYAPVAGVGDIPGIEAALFGTDPQAFEAKSYTDLQETLTAERYALVRSQWANRRTRTDFFQRHGFQQSPVGYRQDVMAAPPQYVQPQYVTRVQPAQPQYVQQGYTPAPVHTGAVLPASGSAGRYAYSGMPEMPPAQPGMCYALVRKEAKYETVREQIVDRPAVERVETIPARYVTETQEIVVREAHEQLQSVPPTYRTETAQVLQRPASTEYVSTPPRTRTVTERILVKPAQTVWKLGRGAIERVDQSTGEIMCLVEEPAEYQTITRQVVEEPASVRAVQQPPVYGSVSRQVVARPGTVQRVLVPEQRARVPVTRQVTPPQTRTVVEPAQYKTIEKRVQVQPGGLEWRAVLCDVNLTPPLVRDIQQALKRAGFDPGPVDGVVGSGTMRAVHAYQRAKGLPSDEYINIETARHLGVRV